MPLTPGEKLGPYEILAQIGEGGMGQVYKARDMRLGRDVAIKVSKERFSERFEREARAAAALNHPNIVAIYDIGPNFIVMEFVDGQPLRGSSGGINLSLRKILDYAVQIASGLAAAHAAGVVHRDLKPGNILLTRDGRVKILDFGLAKIARPRPASEHDDTVTAHTNPGTVMGTAGYMSPEQVRGQTADHRSDIFSFGLILYEMLSGHRAFRGETSIETMTAILKQDAAELPVSVPSGVREVVRHCLEKRPEHRFQSALDLSFALAAVWQSGSPPATAAVLPARQPRLRLALRAAALVLIAVAAGSAFLWRRPASEPSRTRTYLGGTEVAMSPRLSPDGHTVGFIAFVGGFMQVGVLRPETGDRAILTRSVQNGWIQNLSWSPDGTKIYYDRWTDVPRGIYSVPTLGGDERPVLEDAAFPEALADGTLLLFRYNAERQMQLFRYWPETGRLQGFPLESLSNGANPAAVFPDTKEAVATAALIGPGRESGQHLYRVDLTSGAIQRLPTGLQDESFLRGLAVTRDGKSVLIFAPPKAGWLGGNILQIPRNGRAQARTLFPVTGIVTTLDTGPDGSIYLDQMVRPVELLRFTAQGGHAERFATFPVPSALDSLAVLPDGRVVIAQFTAGRQRLIAVGTEKDPTPLVATDEETTPPVTAAGEGEVAFLIGFPPHQAIGLATVSNGRITHRIDFQHGLIASLASSPDGKTLYCAADGAIWSVPIAGGEPKMIRAGNAVAMDPAGQYLLVEVVEAPKIRLLRVPLNGGAEREIPQTGPLRPANVIGPNSIGKDGRILMPLGSSTWDWPPGVVDPAIGKFVRIPIDYTTDHHVLGWAPDGSVIAYGLGMQSTMWKFTPQGR